MSKLRGSLLAQKVSKIGNTLGNIASRTSSALKTAATSSGPHLIKSAGTRTATASAATMGLGALVGSFLIVASTVTVGYLTYAGIRELVGEKKR